MPLSKTGKMNAVSSSDESLLKKVPNEDKIRRLYQRDFYKNLMNLHQSRSIKGLGLSDVDLSIISHINTAFDTFKRTFERNRNIDLPRNEILSRQEISLQKPRRTQDTDQDILVSGELKNWNDIPEFKKLKPTVKKEFFELILTKAVEAANFRIENKDISILCKAMAKLVIDKGFSKTIETATSQFPQSFDPEGECQALAEKHAKYLDISQRSHQRSGAVSIA